MREPVEPTVSEGRTGQCDPHERYNHPALRHTYAFNHHGWRQNPVR